MLASHNEIYPDGYSHHPCVVEFHLMDLSNPDTLTMEQRQVIAQAYTLHDTYYNKSLDDLVNQFQVTHPQYISAIANELGRHVTKCIQERPELLTEVLGGNIADIVATYHSDYWDVVQRTNALYQELITRIQTGEIHDVQSYYNYMTVHHLDNVLEQGW